MAALLQEPIDFFMNLTNRDNDRVQQRRKGVAITLFNELRPLGRLCIAVGGTKTPSRALRRREVQQVVLLKA